jgi:hypothetical protein
VDEQFQWALASALFRQHGATLLESIRVQFEENQVAGIRTGADSLQAAAIRDADKPAILVADVGPLECRSAERFHRQQPQTTVFRHQNGSGRSGIRQI